MVMKTSLLWSTAVSRRLHGRNYSNFIQRHIGTIEETKTLLKVVECSNMEEFIEKVVPESVLKKRKVNMGIGKGLEEHELLAEMRKLGDENVVGRNFVGMGYYGTRTPTVIQRNVIENPAWYTQYTPYQPEISQGRLESLLNYQTMVCDLTGMEMANASLLDEGTAAAEAMNLFWGEAKDKKEFLVDENVHPQTIACVQTRAEALGIIVKVVDVFQYKDLSSVFGVLIQYPDTHGLVKGDLEKEIKKMKEKDLFVACATDLLALAIMKPPGEMGVDISFGNAQRFGVPMGYGGPHAAFFACKDRFKRKIPGRLIGVSRDADGGIAYRLTLQTREQHIKREKATSNICTAQALLANVSAMYGVYHGPEGLRDIAKKIHQTTKLLKVGLHQMGVKILNAQGFFDTLTVEADAQALKKEAKKKNINCRWGDGVVGISLDETTTLQDIKDLLEMFAVGLKKKPVDLEWIQKQLDDKMNFPQERTSSFLEHPVFNTYHSEAEITRYIHRLQSKDLSLVHSMIPLGSCTMKLNSTTEMMPLTMVPYSSIHPFAPKEQAAGYHKMIKTLEKFLCGITGMDGVSLQPNSGAQGEYAGLRVIRQFQKETGQGHRKKCLIPVSAHGTNPASAAMSGLQVIPVKCTSNGYLDLDDLRQKLDENVSCMMITYPSTFGVFEPTVLEACELVHRAGGQVYMDGANLNAQVGICTPGDLGFDVCHLNLHKTFCIPHGGGGPGMGPIAVKKHLIPFLPSHPVIPCHDSPKALGPISAAPYGSASILTISYAYIRMMGDRGLTLATQHALLNANYLAKMLSDHYTILYTNDQGFVAHEFIIDIRPFIDSAGIEGIDVAKRLQDCGFHSPTMSWPVPNTIMIEPTESESKEELDRFIAAMIHIRSEIRDIERGVLPRENNPLVHAPHTLQTLLSSQWDRPYSREQAAFPLSHLRRSKFWPSVSRLDDVYGDRNIVCSCPPIESYQ